MSGTDHYYNTINHTYQSSQVFKDWGGDLEIGRLTSDQKSEFTGTRHGVNDRERDGPLMLLCVEFWYKYNYF